MVILLLAESKEPAEYYIKWESLPYAEATWEDAALIQRKWPKKIQEFKDREESKRTPSKLCRALKSRPKFVKILDQPEYMGGDQVCLAAEQKKIPNNIYTEHALIYSLGGIKQYDM